MPHHPESDPRPILKKATQHIKGKYFRLTIDGGPPTYRERVYCYELYHQLRCHWPGEHYTINGEVDKSGHPYFKKELRNLKPDLIIHEPGNMEGNLAAIEVKPADFRRPGVKKDFRTLINLTQRAQYQLGILLIFGDYNKNKVAIIRSALEEARIESGLPIDKIEVWWHKKPSQEAERILCDPHTLPPTP